VNNERELAVAIAGTLDTEKPVQPANPRRGAGYREAAVDFLMKWPIGSVIPWEDACDWMFENGILEASWPDITDKSSDEWMAFLQRRHVALSRLNKASSHPSLIPYGGAFYVASQGAGSLVVRSAMQQMLHGTLADKVGTVAVTKRKQLEYLIQSTDWGQLPPHLRLTVEDLKDDLDNWSETIALAATHMEQRLAKLSSRLGTMVKLGQIKPVNGGIAGLLTDETE
jgi:hypothetical protein